MSSPDCTSSECRKVPGAVLRVVIGDGEIRTPTAQRLAVRQSRRRRHGGDEAERHYRPRYDQKAGTVTVGRMTIKVAELLHELSAAAGPDNSLIDAEPDQYVTLKVRLTQAESKRLIAAAKRAELPDWVFVQAENAGPLEVRNAQ